MAHPIYNHPPADLLLLYPAHSRQRHPRRIRHLRRDPLPAPGAESCGWWCSLALYGGAAFVMMRVWEWGSVGLVGANIVNTTGRIVWSVLFIRRWARVREGRDRKRGHLEGDCLEKWAGTSAVWLWVCS